MNRFLQIFKVKDLRKKVLIVVGLLLGFLNLFSGGGLENLSVAMLGVGPYITATIIVQLLTIIFPKFKQMYYEEGARGQAKFNQYSRMLTVPLAILQGYGFLNLLIAQGVI